MFRRLVLAILLLFSIAVPVFVSAQAFLQNLTQPASGGVPILPGSDVILEQLLKPSSSAGIFAESYAERLEEMYGVQQVSDCDGKVCYVYGGNTYTEVTGSAQCPQGTTAVEAKTATALVPPADSLLDETEAETGTLTGAFGQPTSINPCISGTWPYASDCTQVTVTSKVCEYASSQPSAVLCPDGSQAPNGDTGQCPAPPSCPSGQTLNSDNECVTNACASIFGSLFELFGTCTPTSPSCPSGSSLGEDGQCHMAPSCPSGQILQNGVCTAISVTCQIGYTEENNTCSFTGCPSDYAKEGSQCVLSSCPTGYTIENAACTFTGCPSGEALEGSSCEPQTIAPPTATIATWKVAPLIVPSGAATNVSWDAENVASCSVLGSNGNSWTGVSGTETSSPIVQQTVYHLTCTGEDGSQIATSSTVDIVPTFEER